MRLETFFQQHPKAALGFSGGVDSSYLLYAGLRAGADIRPYFMKSVFQPAFELEDALRLGRELGAGITVLELPVLDHPQVARNGPDRCYHCKQAIFGAIAAQAARDGYALLLDGTNASDDAADRPGMRALTELSVRSPLRECGLTKAEVRRLSKEAGLFTWDKPAYACLATRIPTGTPITRQDLERVERAEDALFQLGFSDFRVRVVPGGARLEIPPEQMPRMMERRPEVLAALSADFEQLLLDLKGR